MTASSDHCLVDILASAPLSWSPKGNYTVMGGSEILQWCLPLQCKGVEVPNLSVEVEACFLWRCRERSF